MSEKTSNTRFVGGCDFGSHHNMSCTVIMKSDDREHMEVVEFKFGKFDWARKTDYLLDYEQNVQKLTLLLLEEGAFAENLMAWGLPVRAMKLTAKSWVMYEGLKRDFERGRILINGHTEINKAIEGIAWDDNKMRYRPYQYKSDPYIPIVFATALAWYGVRQPGAVIQFA